MSQTAAENARPHRLFDLDEWDSATIVDILDTAIGMKEVLGRPIKQAPALRGLNVATLFFDDDSATRLSFELAARALSAHCAAIAPGEAGAALPDMAMSLRALGIDILIVRHPEAGAPYLIAQHFQGALINGGDGCHAHPTQALADLFTIREKLGRLDHRKVVIVGDLLHSGGARSLLWGLGAMDARAVLCAPHTLLGSEAAWKATWPRLTISTDLEECLNDADAVISLPLRDERLRDGRLPSLREYGRFFGLTAERMQRTAPHCLALHHGSVRDGVEMTPAVSAAARAALAEHLVNGVAVRMALLYRLARTPS